MDILKTYLLTCNSQRVFRLLIILCAIFGIFFAFRFGSRTSANPARSRIEQYPYIHEQGKGGKFLKPFPQRLGVSKVGRWNRDRQPDDILSFSGERGTNRDRESPRPYSITSDRSVVEELKQNDTMERVAAIKAFLQRNNYGTVAFNPDYSHLPRGYDQTGPPFIVLLARMRTGSSMIGEIFNQNPTIFYFYEPLLPVANAITNGSVKPEQERAISSYILRENSQCRFPEPFSQIWMEWRGSLPRNLKIVQLCAKSGMNITKCKPTFSANDLKRTCAAAGGRVAVKTIRSDLDYFKPLVDAGINVKIVHLVRDPRGTANSRKLYYTVRRPKLPRRVRTNGTFKGKLDLLGLLGDYPDYVVHTIPRLCQWMRDSILQVKEKPSWLRGRYKLIRYEDFSNDPLRIAKDIYDFIGIQFPLSVREWLVANTRSDDLTSAKLFSTHKNASLTASRWRYSLRPAQVRQVESFCGQAMEMLGYRIAPPGAQQANESIPLTGPLPMDDELQ